MKPSPAFKQVIQDYLVARAKNDSLFAAAYLKPNKNIDDCITYVLNTVSKSGCNGFADDEIYNIAVPYYPKSVDVLYYNLLLINLTCDNNIGIIFTCSMCTFV